METMSEFTQPASLVGDFVSYAGSRKLGAGNSPRLPVPLHRVAPTMAMLIDCPKCRRVAEVARVATEYPGCS